MSTRKQTEEPGRKMKKGERVATTRGRLKQLKKQKEEEAEGGGNRLRKANGSEQANTREGVERRGSKHINKQINKQTGKQTSQKTNKQPKTNTGRSTC